MKKIPIRQITPAFPEPTAAQRFKIRRVEDIVGDTRLVHDLHRHDFFFILALKKGSGSHEIDFTNYEVADHSVFFLRPGQVHRLVLEAGCTGYLAEFNNEFYHPLGKPASQRLQRAGNAHYCAQYPSRFDRIEALLALLFNEYTIRETGYQDVIKSGLDIFFIELMRLRPHQADPVKCVNSYTQERFEAFRELLDQHSAGYKQVTQYAEMMNLSAYQLNEITKSSIGKTASEVINDHILLEARRYLLATSNQVKDIADQLGYDDISYFIRFFKKHVGQSPEAFRNSFK